MWAFLSSRTGIAAILLVGLLALFGVQEVRLKFAQSGEREAKASLALAQGRLQASETLRTSEHAQAVSAASDAENACAARVALAVKSGSAIRKIVEAPHALDPTTHCPLRAVVGAGQLRDAISPH